MKTIAAIVTMICLAGFAVAYATGDGIVTFEMLKQGKELFENNCIECHELDWPLKKVTDRAGWEEILTKMANTGAVVGQEERTLILEYLLAKSVFQRQCVICHGPERALEKHQDFQNWIATVRRMVEKKPGLLTEKDIQAVAGFLTLGM